VRLYVFFTPEGVFGHSHFRRKKGGPLRESSHGNALCKSLGARRSWLPRLRFPVRLCFPYLKVFFGRATSGERGRFSTRGEETLYSLFAAARRILGCWHVVLCWLYCFVTFACIIEWHVSSITVSSIVGTPLKFEFKLQCKVPGALSILRDERPISWWPIALKRPVFSTFLTAQSALWLELQNLLNSVV